MKKPALEPEARRLFVQEGMTFAGIAGTLGVSEKTVRLWKDAGGWEEKRSNFLKGKEQFHQELFDLARKLMVAISEDMDAKRPVDGGRARLFINILSKLNIVKGYEDMLAKLNANPDLLKAGGDLAKLVRDEMFKGEDAG
ncbi:MAG: phage terminase small subunit-related protein [Elusimicrobiales bacterium]